MVNAIKEQVIEQGLNLAVDAARGKDLVEDIREEGMGILKVLM